MIRIGDDEVFCDIRVSVDVPRSPTPTVRRSPAETAFVVHPTDPTELVTNFFAAGDRADFRAVQGECGVDGKRFLGHCGVGLLGVVRDRGTRKIDRKN